MNFKNLIGNEKIKNMLNESVNRQNILHSYLFYGEEGIGKRLFAFEFAKMILCNSEKHKACGACKSCIEFDSNNNPDFFYLDSEGNSIKIDQIRNIQKNILEKPINSLKKVYVINNADTMTKEAQNCLLKTLEEPQDFIVIILIASNENKLLATVRSRCTKIYFNHLNDNEIENLMKDKFDSTNLSKDMIQLCNGSISKCINVIEKSELLKNIEILIDKFENLNKLDCLNYNELFYSNKSDINLLLDYMYVLLFKKAKDKEEIISCMNIIQQTKNKLSNSNNYDMTIDNMLIKMWEEINEKNCRSKV